MGRRAQDKNRKKKVSIFVFLFTERERRVNVRAVCSMNWCLLWGLCSHITPSLCVKR